MDIFNLDMDRYVTAVFLCVTASVGRKMKQSSSVRFLCVRAERPELADSSEDNYNAWINQIKTKKALTEEYSALPADHLVGNAAFTYEKATLDDDVCEKMEAAYKKPVSELGATPEF